MDFQKAEHKAEKFLGYLDPHKALDKKGLRFQLFGAISAFWGCLRLYTTFYCTVFDTFQNNLLSEHTERGQFYGATNDE